MAFKHQAILCERDNIAHILINTSIKKALVIDPTDPKKVEHALKAYEADLVAILNTHSHFDHTSGNTYLSNAFGIPVYGPEKEAKDIPEIRYHLKDGQVLNIAGISIRALETKGHTRGALSFEIEGKALVTGDTLFLLGCGNTNFGGNVDVLYETFANIYMKLDDNLIVLPGHDYSEKNLAFLQSVIPDLQNISVVREKIHKEHFQNNIPFSLLGEEKIYNPFLLVFNENILKDIVSHLKLKDQNPKEAFSKLRQLRNVF